MLPAIASAPLLSLFLALAPAVAVAVAADARPRPIAARGDGVIRAPVRAIPGPGRDAAPKPTRLRGRQNVVDALNQRNGTFYAVEVEVGTPPQTQWLILDTGSPDTWFNPTCSAARPVAECESYPRFDPSESSSIRDLDGRSLLGYGSGQALVDWYTDTLTFGSATITGQVIGIGVATERIPLGILGVSPPVGGVNQYPYVLDTMVDQGLINSRAFSLDLRSVDNPNGAIIFGGIDTGKYIGELARLPILPPRESPLGANRYYVTMTAIGLTLPDGNVVRSEDISTPVFLDSGATLSYLPTRIFEALAASFAGALYDPEEGFYYLPCGVLEADGSIDFYFGAKTIRVALRDFVWRAGPYCLLGALADDDEPVLGATFLRAAYVVFDQDQRALHIAQAANCGENLVAIGSGADAVPSRTGDCTATPEPTATGGLDVSRTRPPTGTFTGAGPTLQGGPGPAADRTGGSPEPTGSENAAGRGAGVGAGVAVALAAANLLAWVL